MNRRLVFAAITTAVTLATHFVAYALSPSPTARVFAGALGGPRPLVVAGVAVTVAALLAALVLILTRIAVRERLQLRHASAPAMPLAAAARRAGGLFAATATLFTIIENVLHYEAGLGVHLVACLTGPVHVDALPILAAFSIAASAAVCAADHLLQLGRRAVAAAAATPVLAARRDVPPRAASARLFADAAPRLTAARGPPTLSPA
jgi:hypothetical protein